MAFLYLSPSTQEFNPYIGGGTEEQYMNRIADELEIWLHSCGISFTRNSQDMTAQEIIRASNALKSDLHLALHSNAAPDALSGMLQGADVYYSPRSPKGKRAALLLAEGLKTIYPHPEKVRAVSSTGIGEVNRMDIPAVLIEFAYHDNPEDAQWIRENTGAIAENVAQSLTSYFALPFLRPVSPRPAKVDVNWGVLNVRSRPSLSAQVVVTVPDNAPLTVWNQYRDWLVVSWNGLSGFAFRDYVTILR